MHCLATEVMAGGDRRRQGPPPSPDPVRSFAEGWCPFTSATVVRRTALVDAGGFPPHLSHSEDRYLLLRLALDRPWAHTPEALMVRHRDGRVRLSDDADAISAADAEIERTYGREVVRRVGLRRGMRFFWIYRGRAVSRRLQARAPIEGRRAAWDALLVLVPELPRSLSSFGRPIVVLVLGWMGYQKVRNGYHHRHHRHADRQRT